MIASINALSDDNADYIDLSSKSINELANVLDDTFEHSNSISLPRLFLI